MTAILLGLAVICAVNPLVLWVFEWPGYQATRRRIVQDYPDELPDTAAQDLADAADGTLSLLQTTVVSELSAAFALSGIIHPGIGGLVFGLIGWALVIWWLVVGKRHLADAAEWQRRWPELRRGLARQLGLNLSADPDPAPQPGQPHVGWQAVKALLGIR